MNYYRPNSSAKFTATPETKKKNTTYQIFLDGKKFMASVSQKDLIDAGFIAGNGDIERTNEGA